MDWFLYDNGIRHERANIPLHFSASFNDHQFSTCVKFFEKLKTLTLVKLFKNGPSKICRRQPLENFTYLDLHVCIRE